MKVVISQPMFFPWLGLFEQIYLSDLYVHMDDVQMPGAQSFLHRVQLKGPNGVFWWNAPISRKGLLTPIRDVQIHCTDRWIRKSRVSLEQTLIGLPFKKEALDIFNEIISKQFTTLTEFNKYSIEYISSFLGIGTKFKTLKRSRIENNKTDNLISILKKENATTYISGQGGLNYIETIKFEQASIKIDFMDYKKKSYAQNYGCFTPYVSILHPIAALGKGATSLFISNKDKGNENADI